MTVCPHCGHRGTSGNDSAFFRAQRKNVIALFRRTRKQAEPTEWTELVGCPVCRKVFIGETEQA